MKIAVACDGDRVADQFGRCEGFRLYFTDGFRIVREESLSHPGMCTGFLPNYLSGLDVQVVIAGTVPYSCAELLEAWSISVVSDIRGDTRDVVRQFLEGQLPAGIGGAGETARELVIR